MLKKDKIILGFDPGIADTGWGLISKNNQSLRFIAAGSIKTAKGKKFSSRLEIIYQEVDELIKKYQPDIVAVEKLFFAKNAKTALDVGQARGVLLLAIIKNNKEILEFTPLQIKQAVCANGQAAKKQVGLMVKAILKLTAVPQPDDAADGLATAITASFFNKNIA
ncbi:MAG: crossover junction endodeoxyribonuclease RuvC [Candidatus Komeilibacteria bacterium RIFOXYC1_FULL_37_11]|uniref:Crossover junction endodeoxyribonuclease RuvC n=1 Tax=Candidatus Komeilibacteria bacterium RIFOXYC1_FULL_37_11 TaxID=1798555 RepID=A0A1G2BYR7_9BACT|nr:MAG: crossover junction endodeoxyribonuclease RuvC [Candidatus Komeilibacteria bacterium RIFOXYC1_FULL_37_11]OGY95134.1 MAG: crossover junction endodeoxyribonuclease RuvC [Candidatus Komeilibacteria bacterium RIFOXYD1_FULL_37_29]